MTTLHAVPKQMLIAFSDELDAAITDAAAETSATKAEVVRVAVRHVLEDDRLRAKLAKLVDTKTRGGARPGAGRPKTTATD